MGNPLDSIPPMGQLSEKAKQRLREADPDKPSYSYETGPMGHRDCDHANDYCQYTPHNHFVPMPRESE